LTKLKSESATARPAEVRLLIVDDHPVFRLGLTTLLQSVPHFSLLGEASTKAEAIAQARRLRPDVILMDVRLPDGSGVEACREIRAERPQARVIILTSFPDEDAVLASILAGAAGYLLKESDPRWLLAAIERTVEGGSLLDPHITDTVLGFIRRASEHPVDPMAVLSEQERRILSAIAEGLTNREIAVRLVLSEFTVKTYVSNILQKLHLARRAEAAAFSVRHQHSTS